MITKAKMLWSFIKFIELIIEEMYGEQSGEYLYR